MTAGKRVFITGGASGLGRALAERYAAAGWRVCFGDVDRAGGAAVAAAIRAGGGDAHFLPCDVTAENDLAAAAAWMEAAWGGADVVVNNAGVSATGRIEDVSLADWRWIIDINLLGVVRGSMAFVPLLKRQGHGHIVNVSSLAGLANPPLAAPYNAVKAAVIAVSETLYSELSRDGIDVSVVCPSFFRTNLAAGARGDAVMTARTRKFLERSPFSAEQVADAVIRGVDRRTFRILPDGVARRVWRLKRLLPLSVFAPLLRRRMRLA